MRRDYIKWYSPSLHRDMELLAFGHGGFPIVVFPTSGGRFWEYEDRGMVKALAAPFSIAVLEPGELLAGLDVAGEQFFPEGYFCTGFYLIADEETGLLRYAGVGHPPVLSMRTLS